jgi:hypothetical protein
MWLEQLRIVLALLFAEAFVFAQLLSALRPAGRVREVQRRGVSDFAWSAFG